METTKSGLVECVCVWLDDVSEAANGKSYWIISHDRIELPSGNADATNTITALDADDHDEDDAMENGLLEARELGLPLYRNFAGQPAEAVTFPRKITISDGIGHMREELTLAGIELTGEKWVTDTLSRNDCEIVDTMTDEAIRAAVYAAYSGEGYEGDPKENGLSVEVEAA